MKANVTIASYQIAIFTVFLAAKLGGNINWEWWIVASPLWVVYPVMVLAWFIAMTFAIVLVIYEKIMGN